MGTWLSTPTMFLVLKMSKFQVISVSGYQSELRLIKMHVHSQVIVPIVTDKFISLQQLLILKLCMKPSQTSKPLRMISQNSIWTVSWLRTLPCSKLGELRRLDFHHSTFQVRMALSLTQQLTMVMPLMTVTIWLWVKIINTDHLRTSLTSFVPSTKTVFKPLLTGCQTKSITSQEKKWLMRLVLMVMVTTK